MAKKYWEEFYKTFKEESQTTFLTDIITSWKYPIDREDFEKGITELGAGNGRDTKLWKACGFPFMAFDYAFESELVKKIALKEVLMKRKAMNVVYSRFFLHCLKKKEITDILDWAKNYFVAEFRIKGDKPILYTNHKRYLVDLGWLVNEMIKRGFQIKLLEVGKGLAKYKKEDPLVARIVANKIKK